MLVAYVAPHQPGLERSSIGLGQRHCTDFWDKGRQHFGEACGAFLTW